jgi:hypothetical protein
MAFGQGVLFEGLLGDYIKLNQPKAKESFALVLSLQGWRFVKEMEWKS